MPRPTTPMAPQAGIVNRPPEHCLLAAFRLDTPDPLGTRAAVEEIRRIVSAELRSDLDNQGPGAPKDQPSPESGELGFDDGHDRAHLTITVGFAATAYDKLGTALELRPQDLVPIPWSLLGDAPAQPDQGDILLHVCSDDLFVCEHAVRRVEQELGAQVALLWTQIGAQRYTSRQGRTNRHEGRAVTGFIDGTSNLDPRHDDGDGQRLTFVDPDAVGTYPALPVGQPPGYGGEPGTAFPSDLRPPPAMEPGWVRHGTYVTVRVSTIDTASWDRTTLGDQEADMGRFKHSGAFLDRADDVHQLEDPPLFEGDQSNRTVALDSHVRKANPRHAEDADRRIFRRGYPLMAGSHAGFERGLVFVCFARSLSTQFEFIMRAWMRNANFPEPGAGADRLFKFEKQVITGGYYFVPPLEHRNQPWSWIVPG